MEAEIILIDNDEAPQGVTQQHHITQSGARNVKKKHQYPQKLPGIAQRILKKQITSSGLVKYLVKWQGYSEEHATWENEDIMKEKHNELIQDYEFFVLTGERFHDQQEMPPLQHFAVPEKKQNNLIAEQMVKENPQPVQQPASQNSEKSQGELEQPVDKQQVKKKSKRAIKCSGKSVSRYLAEDYQTELQQNQNEEKTQNQCALNTSQQSDVNEQSKQNRISLKQQEKSQKRINAEPFVDFDSKILKNQQLDSEVMEVTQKSQKIICALKNQFTLQSNIYNNLQATEYDKIESVTLSSSNDEKVRQIFRIDWQPRVTGEHPYSEYYSYQQVSQLCPQMCLKFLESFLFGIEDNSLGIRFVCQGATDEEKFEIIQQAINPNKKAKIENYKGAEVMIEEEHSQNEDCIIETDRHEAQVEADINHHSGKQNAEQESHHQNELELENKSVNPETDRQQTIIFDKASQALLQPQPAGLEEKNINETESQAIEQQQCNIIEMDPLQFKSKNIQEIGQTVQELEIQKTIGLQEPFQPQAIQQSDENEQVISQKECAQAREANENDKESDLFYTPNRQQNDPEMAQVQNIQKETEQCLINSSGQQNMEEEKPQDDSLGQDQQQ